MTALIIVLWSLSASASSLSDAKVKFVEEQKNLSLAPVLQAWPQEMSLRPTETNGSWLAAFAKAFRKPIEDYLSSLPRGKAAAFPAPPDWYVALVQKTESNAHKFLSGTPRELVGAIKAFGHKPAVPELNVPARLIEPNRAARQVTLSSIKEGNVLVDGAAISGKVGALILRPRTRETLSGNAKLALLPGLTLPSESVGTHPVDKADVLGLDLDGDRKWDIVYFSRPKGEGLEFLIIAHATEKAWAFSVIQEG